MSEFLQRNIFGFIEVYRLLMCILMLVLYGSYSHVKKKNPKKVMYIANTTLVLATLYIVINLFLKEISQDVYFFIVPFVVVAFILRNQAKHDKRGSKVYEIINFQNKWDKIKIVFIPKEFTDEEINTIYNVLREVFDRINGNIKSDNIGGLFIKICKRKKVKKINIINILDSNKKEELKILNEIYCYIGKKYYGDLNIKKGKLNKIELDMII